MSNKKWAVKRITVNLSKQESAILEQYCTKSGRPATDVTRELIRGLSLEKASESADNFEQTENMSEGRIQLLVRDRINGT
jgi:hypothetical protein